MAEINEFIGFIAVKQLDHDKAIEVLSFVLQWIDNGSRKALPMIAVAAANMRRTTLMGLGMAKELKAAADTKLGLDGRSTYDAALSHLIEGLDQHVERHDAVAVKDTLLTAYRCFIGIKDPKQAVTTVEKYVNYCKRSQDVEGATSGETLLEAICAQYSLPNPLVLERAAEAAAEKAAAERAAKAAADKERPTDSP